MKLSNLLIALFVPAFAFANTGQELADSASIPADCGTMDGNDACVLTLESKGDVVIPTSILRTKPFENQVIWSQEGHFSIYEGKITPNDQIPLWSQPGAAEELVCDFALINYAIVGHKNKKELSFPEAQKYIKAQDRNEFVDITLAATQVRIDDVSYWGGTAIDGKTGDWKLETTANVAIAGKAGDKNILANVLVSLRQRGVQGAPHRNLVYSDFKKCFGEYGLKILQSSK